MRNFRLFLLLCCCALFVAPLAAQNNRTNRAARRAENNVNNRVDRKIDAAVNDALDGLFKKKEKPAEKKEGEKETAATDDAATTTSSGGLFGGGGGDWEPIKNDNPFSFSMIATETKRNGKTETTEVDMTWDTWLFGTSTKTEDGPIRMILDNQTGKVTTVTTDGQAMRMRMPNLQEKIAEAAAEHNEEYKIVKTGRTKTIDGYRAEEYRMTNDDGVTLSWCAKIPGLDTRALAGMAGAQAKKGSTNLIGVENAFPLEATYTPNNGKSTTFIRYTNIKTGAQIDRSILDLKGIKVMDLGF